MFGLATAEATATHNQTTTRTLQAMRSGITGNILAHESGFPNLCKRMILRIHYLLSSLLTNMIKMVLLFSVMFFYTCKQLFSVSESR